MQLDLLDTLACPDEHAGGTPLAVMHAMAETAEPHAGAASWVAVRRGPAGLEWLAEGATGRLVTRPLQLELHAVCDVLTWFEGREFDLWVASAPCYLGLLHHLPRWREAGWRQPDGTWLDQAWLWQRVSDLLDLSAVSIRGHLAEAASPEVPPSALQRAAALAQLARDRADIEDAAPF